MLARQHIDDVLDWAEAERVPTPALLLAPQVLTGAVARLREPLGARVSFAAKANPLPQVLRALDPLVDEFNVTNVAHLRRLVELGVEPGRIVMAHPMLPADAVRATAELGVTRFVIDDERGLEILRSVLARPRVTLRLLPPDLGQSDRSVVRFGNTGEALVPLAAAVTEAGGTVEALSFFVGTSGADMATAAPFRRGIARLDEVRQKLAAAGLDVPTVNIGGGFPGAQRRFYRHNPEFFGRIAATIADRFGQHVDVLCEPGRYLAEPTMALLTRVGADRTVDGRRLVQVDASAYTTLFESVFIGQDSETLPIGCRATGTEAALVGTDAHPEAALVGPIMDSFDVLRRAVRLPRLAPGQPLLVPNVGAYCHEYALTPEGLAGPTVVEVPDGLAAAFAETWFD